MIDAPWRVVTSVVAGWLVCCLVVAVSSVASRAGAAQLPAQGGTPPTTPTTPTTTSVATTTVPSTTPTAPTATTGPPTAPTNPPTTMVTTLAPPQLRIDRDMALFDVAGLVPGARGSGCLTLQLDGEAERDEVRLFGEVAGSGLASYLSLTIETGLLDATGSCASLAVSTVFVGTLAAFGDRHRDAATGLPLPLDGGRVTVRLTWELQDDNAAQGLTGLAAFVFEARGTRVVLEPAPVTPTPTVPATTVPATTVPATTTPSSATTATPTTSPSSTGRPAPGESSSSEGDSAAEQVIEALTEWLPASLQAPFRRTMEVGVLTTELAAKTSAFPSTFVVALVVFLLFQHRIDLADPRLVRAPTHPEPDLEFVPRPTVGGSR